MPQFTPASRDRKSKYRIKVVPLEGKAKVEHYDTYAQYQQALRLHGANKIKKAIKDYKPLF